MQPANDKFYILLIIATAGVVLLVSTVMLLVIMQRNKILRHEKETQQAALLHQKALIVASVNSQEKERNYIGAELHDHIVNALTLLRLLVNKEDKGAAMEVTDKIIGDVRKLSHNLSPASLKLFGIVEAIRDMSMQLQQNTNMYIDIIVDNEPAFDAIPHDISLHCYRTLQELITNTLKHAEAKRISMALHINNGLLQIEYKDDGKGFDYADKTLFHNGMHNIESRMQVIQGRYDFFSVIGKGMKVSLFIPIKQTNESNNKNSDRR